MADGRDCQERLPEVGQCDLQAGHFPGAPHVLVNEDAGPSYSKTIWPVAADDPDVKRYIAFVDAADEEEDRLMAERATAGGANANG